MKKVKSITIYFDSLEKIKIPAKFLGQFEIKGIKETIERIDCSQIWNMKTADFIKIEILKNDLIDFIKIGSKYNISNVIIRYTDDTKDNIWADYKDKDEGIIGSDNLYQKNYISKDGNLYILISEVHRVEDVFTF